MYIIINEIWKEIPGTSGLYQASTAGRIKSIDRTGIKINRWGFESPWRIKGRVLKPWTDSNSYLVVYICGDGRREAINVHRLVAITFLPLPEKGGLDVNHLDGNKQNNEPHNLEWCTRKQNMAHALAIGLYDQRKPLVGTPINGGNPVFFSSSREAALAIAPSEAGKSNIRSAATGKLRQAYGYFWKHVAA